ncbi:uncharacterized protein LOC123313621 isoform X2 [Coccinella septempunctata]|uniref:uncharacterized protein LOC123313621 isoform X2 n=1 Tax=Coccinella septempunctata TaxID=41139 RepID=UPI001D08D1FC|nr:uncharacterized protein LOC123313621 isoform X2 [Coccinella septempunctata]
METLILSNRLYTDQDESDSPSGSSASSASPLENFSPGTSLEDIISYQSDTEFLNYCPGTYPTYLNENGMPEDFSSLSFFDENNHLNQQQTLPLQLDNLCDTINYNAMGYFSEDIEPRKPLLSPICDKVNFSAVSDTFNEIMDQSETLEASYRKVFKDDSFLDAMGNFSDETNVDRHVDKQLNSSNVIHSDVDHIEEVLPSLEDISSILERDGLSDIVTECMNDQATLQMVNQKHDEDTQNTSLCGAGTIAEDIQQMITQNVKTEPQMHQPKIEAYKRTAPNVLFNPKVAGRKRIDWKAQKYIIDNDDEDKEIDIVTVTKEDEPVIEANDVNSLLEQFELNQSREGSTKKIKKSPKENVSGIKKDKSSHKLKKHKLKETITRPEKGRLAKLSEKMFEKMKNSCLEKKPSHNSVSHKSEGKRLPKPECSKPSEKLNSSKSNDTHDLKKKKSEEVNAQSTKKIHNSHDKQGRDKNREMKNPKAESVKVNCKQASPEAKVEVPKELIGKIKEGIKPRKVVLLEDPHLFGNFGYDKKKSSKPRVSANNSSKSASPKSDSTNDPSKKPVGTSNNSSTQTNGSVKSRLASSLAIQPISNNLAQKPAINKPSAVPAAQKPINRSSSSSTSMQSRAPIGSGKMAQKPVINGSSAVPPRPISNHHPTSRAESFSAKTARPMGGKRLSPPKLVPIKPVVQACVQSHQKIERQMWQHINLDHSYHRRIVNPNMHEKENSHSIVKIEPKVEPGQIQTNEWNLKGANGKVLCNRISNNKVKMEVPNERVEESKDIVKESIKQEVKAEPSDKVTKKIWKYEDYIKKKGVPAKSNAPSENRSRKSDSSSHEEWVKKMGLVIHPQVPDDLLVIETFDAAVSACLVDEKALDTLAGINPILEKSNAVISQNSFINCFKETLNNKIEPEGTPDGVIREHKVIRYVKKDEKKPEMCSMGVQTTISLMESRPRKRSLSISSVSSDEDYDRYSVDSRSSKHSRSTKRSRSSSKHYRSRTRSRSPLHLYNPNIELPTTFRSKAEHDEFRQDAINRCIVFLGDITEEHDEETLTRLFIRYGHIKRVKIYHRREKRRRTSNGPQSENFAFVTFSDSMAAFDALQLYKRDYPDGPHFQMCFGGRREFCNEHYSDLDNMPSWFEYEDKPFASRPQQTFDSMLKEYKQQRNQMGISSQSSSR